MKSKFPNFPLFFVLFIFFSSTILAQSEKGMIQGKIKTSDLKPADNVTVTLKDTKIYKNSDDNGEYELTAPAGNYILIVKQMGVKTVEQAVEINSGKTTVVKDIVLELTNTELQGVTISAGHINKFTRKQSDYVAKMPLKNLENPQVYSSISKELLKDQQITNLDDALKNAAGVSKSFESTGRAGSGGTTFVLRGFVTQSKVRNGLAGNITTAIDAANVETLEVLKGPSATLFGNSLSSYGGLINRVTKKPFKTTAGEVSYYTGSYGLNRVAVDFNTPLDSDHNVLFRVNTSYNSQNSFQENGFRKSFLFAPSLSYQINDRLSFNIDAEFSQLQSAGSQFLYFSGNTKFSDYGINSAADVGINYKSSFSSRDMIKRGSNANFFGQLNYQISSNWKSQSNVSITTSASNGSSPYYYLTPGAKVRAVTAVTAPGVVPKTYNDEFYLQRMVWDPNGVDLNAEIQQNFIGDFKIGKFRNRLTLGLDYLQTNTDIKFNRFSNNDYYNPAGATAALKGSKINDFFDYVSISNPGNDYYNFDQTNVNAAYTNRPAGTTLLSRSNTTTYSVFAADVFNITDDLMALVSLRVDRFENNGILNNSTNIVSQGYRQTAFSPKFGIVYQIIPEQVSLFTNYQNGFTNKTGTDFEGKAYKPEQANQYEGGVKFDLLNGKISGTVSYYDIKVENIVRAYDLNPQLNIQNGTQSSKGLEFELTANPVAGLNLIAGYGYNDSKYTNTSANLDGLRPTNAGPANLLNLWASYRINRGVLEGLGAGLGGNYASENYAINTVALGKLTLPSYTVYNAAIFYEQKKFRIGFKLNNIGNKHYWVGNGTMNPQMLREFVANLSFKF